MDSTPCITADDVNECAQLFARQEDYMEWEKLSQCTVRDHDVHIHRKPREGSDLYDLFAYGSLPITAEQLADINFDHEYRLKWDSYAKDIRVVRSFVSQDQLAQDLMYWEVAFPWPMSNRDYVFLRHRQVVESSGLIVLISKGLRSTEVEEVSGVIRVEDLRTFIAIRGGVDGGCEFSMLYFDDMKYVA